MFSRLVPGSQGRSFYEELRRRDDDTESRAGLLDEENLNHHFQTHDLEHADGLGVDDSRTTLGGVTSPPPRARDARRGRPQNDLQSAWAQHEEDADNDVPASLLVEHEETDPNKILLEQARLNMGRNPVGAIPGPSTAHAQWQATQAQQRLHNDDTFLGQSRRNNGLPNSLFAGMATGSAKKKAEWRWANVSNLDIFIKDVYDYYVGHGMSCILVERVLHLL